MNGLEIAWATVAALLAALNGVLLVNYKKLNERVAENERTSTQIKDNYISRFEKVHTKIAEMNTELKVALATTKGEILTAISNLAGEIGKSYVPKVDCDKNCERVIAGFAAAKRTRRRK